MSDSLTNIPADLPRSVDGPTDGRVRWLPDFAQDLRIAWRGLFRNPGFALITALTIALGVGATTTVFSLMNALLFRPPAVTRPEQVFALQEKRENNVSTDFGYLSLPYPRYLAYQEATGNVFTGLAALRFGSFSLRFGEDAIATTGLLTSANYFSVLGLRPAIGRFYSTDSEPVVVLSHRLWRERFGGETSVIGRTVQLDSRPYAVAGVAPAGFEGTHLGLDQGVWVPIRAHRPAAEPLEDVPWVFPFGRLRPDLTEEAATAAVAAAARRIPPEESYVKVRGAELDPMTGLAAELRQPVASFLSMFFATAVLVLLIASANIAGMLLARAVARRREIAIRLAIGAARGRLVRQLLTETLVLFLLGAIPGVALTVVAANLLERLTSSFSLPIHFEVSPDLRVLAFALIVAGVTGIIFGLAPAMQASRADLVSALRGAGVAAGAQSARGRSIFVSAQVTAAVLLLVVAGLFVRALRRGLDVPLGFDPLGVVVGTTNLEPHGYDEEKGRAFYAQLVERLRAQPGVEGVGLANMILVAGSLSGDDVSLQKPGAAERISSSAAHNWVDPGYFTTMRVPIVAGRALNDADRPGGVPAAVINETLATKFWPGESPLGKRFRSMSQEWEVVGVARDGKYWQVAESGTAFVYHAAAQNYRPRMSVHLRTRSTPAEAIAMLRREVRALDPNVALERPAALPGVVGISLLPQRLGAALVGVFGLIGLVLAAIGVYGVLAFQVAQRIREFGIRLALGTTGRGVLGMVLRRGALLAAAGIVVGLMLAAMATRFIERLLFSGLLLGVSPLDPITFVGVPLVLMAVVLLASYIPARRATRVTPLEALRAD